MIIPSGDIGSLITGGAVVVGGALGWLGNMLAGRRSQAESRDDRRRAAYGSFMVVAEELTRLLDDHEIMESVPAAESTVSANAARLVGSIERAYVTVLMVGPEQAQAAADEVRHRARALRQAFSPSQGSSPIDALADLGRRTREYANACSRFTVVAQKLLDR